MQPWRIVRRRQNEIAPELGNIIIDARSSSWPTFSSRNGPPGAELAVAAAPGNLRPGASRAANAQPRTFATLPAAPPDPARAPNSHDESRQLDRGSPMSTSPNDPTPHNQRASSPKRAEPTRNSPRTDESPGPTRRFPTQALRCGAAGARAGERLRRARAVIRQAAEDGARGAVDGAHHGQPLRLL